MSRRAGDRLLNWGFVAALTLHGVVLTAAACFPAQTMKDELSDLRVFDAKAPALMVPVELVQIPAAAEPEPVPESVPVAVAVVRPEPRPKPAVEKPSPPPVQPKPPPTQAVVRPKPPAPEPEPVVARSRPPSTSPRTPVEPLVRPAGGGGGGGGSPVNLGAPSANGDLPAQGGRTPVGVVPGTGAGSGSGVGPGEGGGSGGGTGGGTGPGTGTGSGPGVGTGSGSGGQKEGGFSSRVADRREPVVVFKGNLEYPSSAVANGVEGTVKLRVLVSERGAVEKVTVAESSRDRRLDSAAVEFVRGWRYRPAVQDGEPRSVYTYAVVQFELK